jgi:hypothetical protein
MAEGVPRSAAAGRSGLGGWWMGGRVRKKRGRARVWRFPDDYIPMLMGLIFVGCWAKMQQAGLWGIGDGGRYTIPAPARPDGDNIVPG